MKPTNIKSKYTDDLTRQKRVRFLIKAGLISLAVLASIGTIFYFIFFHGTVDIKIITLEGLNTVDSQEIKNQITQKFEQKYFNYIPHKNNLYFLNTEKLKFEILSKYTILESIDVEKKMPHEIIFKFRERAAIGVWCFGDDCVYFDKDAITWGPAIRSSGFLLITVEDQRKPENREIDSEYFQAVKLLSDKNLKLPIIIKGITIPENSFRDFRANTSAGYDILFSLDSDILQQLEVLKIFLKDEKNLAIIPQQIDLRINGRVYYK